MRLKLKSFRKFSQIYNEAFDSRIGCAPISRPRFPSEHDKRKMREKVTSCLKPCLHNTKCYLTKDGLASCFQGMDKRFPVKLQSQFLALTRDHDSLIFQIKTCRLFKKNSYTMVAVCGSNIFLAAVCE